MSWGFRLTGIRILKRKNPERMALSTTALPLVNYYEVLDVSPNASLRQIQSAFKRQVLKVHPDKNPERREWSEHRIRQLIEAYDVVGKAESREEFDRRYRAAARLRPQRKTNRPFFFDKTDPESRALLVVYYLTNHRGEEAVHLLWEMESRLGRRFLSEYLDRGDYLDSLFLLAEHHEGCKQYREALSRLREFYRHERAARFRRHYFDEAVSRLKDLYLRKLPRSATANEVIDYLAEAKRLGLSSAEERVRLWRLAEAYVKLGRSQAAESILDHLRATFPRAKEIARIEALLV